MRDIWTAGWRRWGATLASAAIAALVYGCSTSSAPSAAAEGAMSQSPAGTVASSSVPPMTATPEPSPTSPATPSPSPQALCSNGDGEFPINVCPLEPGTYSSAPFDPAFRFTIEGGWSNSLAGINAGQITKKGTTRTGFGWATGMTAQDGSDIAKTTTALLGFFASQPDIKVSAPAPATVGGMAGSSIDFTTKGSITFRAGKSGGSFGPGEKVRAIVLDVNGAVVLLTIEVFDGNDFDAEMTEAQAILDSIVWE